MNLYIRKEGKGRTLVLFHGWGFDHSIWLPILPLIKDSYQLYLIDLPGFGQSSLMPWSEFKQKLLLQLPKTFAVLGWSLGGLFASRLAIEEPARVSHLINIASSPCFIAKENWPGIKKEVFTGFYNNLKHDSQRVLKNFVQLQLKNSHYEFQSLYLLSDKSLKEGLEVLEKWDLRYDIRSLQIPSYYLFGRLDSIIPHSLMQTMKIIYPNFNYELINRAAHIPFLSHSQDFVSFLENIFL